MRRRQSWYPVLTAALAAAALLALLRWGAQPSPCNARALAAAPALPTGTGERPSRSPLADIPNRGQGERIITFAGREWVVKAGANLPPRANHWSDSEASVHVDAAGRLHLRVRQIEGVWHSAQVIAREPSRHGLHRILVETPLDGLHPNVVLGVFLYRDDAREIDIEFSRRLAGTGFNALYAVQPSHRSGHRHPFQFGTAGPSAHEIHWQPDWICFRSMDGHDVSGQVVSEWLFERPGVPQVEDALRLQINLWLLDPEQQDSEVEVVITAVTG